MNTGYTKELTEAEKRTNEIAAIRSILQDYPDNQYWQMRLAALFEVEPICCCYEKEGDNENCPKHGDNRPMHEVSPEYRNGQPYHNDIYPHDS